MTRKLCLKTENNSQFDGKPAIKIILEVNPFWYKQNSKPNFEHSKQKICINDCRRQVYTKTGIFLLTSVLRWWTLLIRHREVWDSYNQNCWSFVRWIMRQKSYREKTTVKYGTFEKEGQGFLSSFLWRTFLKPATRLPQLYGIILEQLWKPVSKEDVQLYLQTLKQLLLLN